MKSILGWIFLLTLAVPLPLRAEEAEWSREGAVNVFLLPESEVERLNLRGAKRFFVREPIYGALALYDNSARGMAEKIKSMSPEILKRGVWMTATHPVTYSEKDRYEFNQFEVLMLMENIPYFRCAGGDWVDKCERVY